MKLRDSIKEFPLLKSVVDMMQLNSSVGYNQLLNREFLVDKNKINTLLNQQSIFVEKISSHKFDTTFSKVKLLLSQLKDISGTINSLTMGQVVSEVELFEIKHFAHTTNKVSELLKEIDAEIIQIPSLSEIFSILDPLKTSEIVFYIYDCYSSKVASKREEIKRCNDKDKLNILYVELDSYQNEVLAELSSKIRVCGEDINGALLCMGQYDFLIAASELYIAEGFALPTFSDNKISYKGVFNPILRKILEEKGIEIQKIDIELNDSPLLIVGANMSGKSVLLKTLALSQYLFQYGFFVIADSAVMAIKDNIYISMDNEQTLSGGLSSFAAEMLKIDSIIKKINQNEKPLVLIDEPARTTNPIEGAAIVSAIVDKLFEKNISGVITTHYSNIKSPCRKLSTAGIIESKLDEKINKDNINNYIDYSLKEIDSNNSTSKEALRICEILGIDSDLINNAKTKI